MAKKGQIPWNKGKYMSEEQKIKISKAMKNRPSWNKGIRCSPTTKKRLSTIFKNKHFSPKTEFKKGENTGINNVNWKGGCFKSKWGYIFILKPKHPLAVNNYIMEHRLVIEKYLNQIKK